MQRKYLKYLAISLFLIFFASNTNSFAQEEEMTFHELEPEDDEFQDAFFAAIRYKAIGNYKLALQALDKAEREAEKQKEKLEAIGFERAQNHYYLNEYQESIILLEELLETNKRREVLDWLYQSYMEVRDYKNAKKTITELLGFSEVYLPNFYLLYIEMTHEPKEALHVLNKIREINKNTKQVGFYKELINEVLDEKEVVTTHKDSRTYEKEIQKLQGFLKQEQWEDLQMYMELLLQEENKAIVVWQQLETSNNLKQALQSVEMIFTKGNLPDKSKQNLLASILTGKQDSEVTHQFIDNIYQNLDAKSLKSLGDYYLNLSDIDKAKFMYLNSLAISFDNYSLIIEVLQLLSDTKDYDQQLNLAKNALDYYPMQPMLYLFKGEALIGVEQHSKAKNVLEEGASYIIDQPDLENEFINLLQKTHK